MFDYLELKNFLESNGIKQKFIAKSIDVAEPVLSDILNGKRKCPLEIYARLCKFLKLPFEKFITEEKITV